MSKPCKGENCKLHGSSRCSACQNVWYCSVECRRDNWKDHKITCGKELLSESELVTFFIDAMTAVGKLDLEDKRGTNIKYLKGVVLVAEYQFGDQVPGETFRRLKNGIMFKNDWVLIHLRETLTGSYMNLDTDSSYDIALGYAWETRTLLEIRRSNNDDRDFFFHFINRVYTQLGNILKRALRYKDALYLMQEALTAARHLEHDPTRLTDALSNVAIINGLLKSEEITNNAQEVYNLLSGQHGPEHPDVQDAATAVINGFLAVGNFVDAERFARMNYESLIDPNKSIERKVVAIGKIQLARAWLLPPSDQRVGGPEAAEEAETLAREACDVLENTKRGVGFDDPVTEYLAKSHSILAGVMMERGGRDSEVERTLLRALSLTRECRAGAVQRVPSSWARYDILQLAARLYYSSGFDLDTGYIDIATLEKAKCVYEEQVIIGTALFSADDPRLLHSLERLEDIDDLLSP
jgi:MYND finger